MSISAHSILARCRRPGNAGRHRDDGRPHGTCSRGLRSHGHGHAGRRSLRIRTGRAAGGGGSAWSRSQAQAPARARAGGGDGGRSPSLGLRGGSAGTAVPTPVSSPPPAGAAGCPGPSPSLRDRHRPGSARRRPTRPATRAPASGGRDGHGDAVARDGRAGQRHGTGRCALSLGAGDVLIVDAHGCLAVADVLERDRRTQDLDA